MDIDIITLFIKMLITNNCIYYACNKIVNMKCSFKLIARFSIINLILTVTYVYFKPIINNILLLLSIYFIFAILINKITNKSFLQSLLVMIIAYSISYIALIFGIILGYIPYKIILGNNIVLGTLLTSLVQSALVFSFFKIKRYKNGFAFLKKRTDNEITDAIVLYISITVVLVAALMSTMYDGMATIVNNLLAVLILLGITMYIMIQRTITMQYKHSLLLKTLEEYKEEIDSKDKEIEKLSQEKFNTSKIRHEFYNRQKALELMVKQNMNGNVDKNEVSENILNIVNELTNEYSKECEIIKGLNVLPKTNIVEIDNMFKYMQTECAKNNIDFKLNIQDSLEPLINNYIPKSRLETLLGDHIRDAINAVNKSEKTNKEIMVVLGLKDGVYEICILDNGVEFTIDTLLKLGKEQVTTGGTGIGFLTTFETLKETKASLVISELQDLEYTKSVAFVFNNRCEYVVNSYRAEAIKEKCDREDIIINKNEG
ncbi:MAG: hypothetical protein IKK84_03240 [Clostridia bacterium]|nr:hypothetical protein [Clostridia bacterium]